MATSSITKNFVISGQKQVEMFADAIEASANDRTPRVPINESYGCFFYVGNRRYV